ncbi:MAG: hypothetical protein J6K17_01280 [Oscillospiraceae bacterium]|nr:hypothetical protein [Oscillospiraceae bacterium]
MSLIKKLSAVAVTSAMALSLASCGKDTTWGAKIDDTELRAGIFIYYQSDALSRAYDYMTETDTDVMAITIDGMSTEDWVNDQALKGMQEYVAIENKFDELGLTFENKEDELAKVNVEQWWEYVSEYFEGIGVSQESYLDVAINGEKKAAIFDYYYGEGGEMEVPEDEIKAILNADYARIKYIDMPLKDGEGNLLKSEGKAEIKAMAEEYIERMSTTDVTFEEISKEYDEYYNGLIEAANAAETTDDTTEADDNTIELSLDETTTQTEENDELVLLGSVTSAEYPVPSASVHEKVVGDAMAVGEYQLIEEDEVYYIVYKMDLFADEEYYDYKKTDILNELKGEEFDATVASWTENQTVIKNEAAFDRYTIEKLNETE